MDSEMCMRSGATFIPEPYADMFRDGNALDGDRGRVVFTGSIAVTIMVAAPMRYSSKFARFMIHGTEFGPFTGRVSGEQLRKFYDSAVAEDARTDAILRERTKLPDEMLKQKLSREIFLSPEEAVKYGLVNEIREFEIPAGAKLVQIG